MIRSPTPVTAPDVAIGAAMKQPRETASTHGPVTPGATVRVVPARLLLLCLLSSGSRLAPEPIRGAALLEGPRRPGRKRANLP